MNPPLRGKVPISPSAAPNNPRPGPLDGAEPPSDGKTMDLTGKALVTGASGFVGSAVARALDRARRRGARAGARVEPAARILPGCRSNSSPATCAMRNPCARPWPACASCSTWRPTTGCGRAIPNEIVENNVTGTRIVMQEAQSAGVERIVYTSSVATLECRAGGEAADESRQVPEGETIGAYKRSKLLAEQLVEKMVAQGLPAVIVNPSTPIGPRDVKPTPTGRLIFEAAAGRVPAFVDTGLNMVHVDDVAAGPYRGARARPHRRALYPRRAERLAVGDSRNRRAADRPARRRASSSRARWSIRSPMPRKRWRNAPGASRSSPWTACACRRSACFSPRPRPSANWATARGPMPKVFATPSIGFGRRGGCDSARPICRVMRGLYPGIHDESQRPMIVRKVVPAARPHGLPGQARQ